MKPRPYCDIEQPGNGCQVDSNYHHRKHQIVIRTDSHLQLRGFNLTLSLNRRKYYFLLYGPQTHTREKSYENGNDQH